MKQNELKRTQSVINIKHSLKKQQTSIEQLQREKNEVLKNLDLAESDLNEKTNDENCMALGAIASRKDNLEHKLHKTKKLNDRLDNDINKLENVLLKKDIILSRAHHKETIQNSDIDKKIQTYENRLNKEMVTYNKMLTENNKLREQIQHIRREHAKFEAKNNRLDAILEEKRQLQAAMVDDGNLAFDSQEDAKQRGLGLADRNDKVKQEP